MLNTAISMQLMNTEKICRAHYAKEHGFKMDRALKYFLKCTELWRDFSIAA